MLRQIAIFSRKNVVYDFNINNITNKNELAVLDSFFHNVTNIPVIKKLYKTFSITQLLHTSKKKIKKQPLKNPNTKIFTKQKKNFVTQTTSNG